MLRLQGLVSSEAFGMREISVRGVYFYWKVYLIRREA
jgi:hypothetical protein